MLSKYAKGAETGLETDALRSLWSPSNPSYLSSDKEGREWEGQVREINPRDLRHPAAKGWGGRAELREKLSPRYSGHWTTKAGLGKGCCKEPLEGVTSREIPHSAQKSGVGLEQKEIQNDQGTDNWALKQRNHPRSRKLKAQIYSTKRQLELHSDNKSSKGKVSILLSKHLN